MNYELSKLEKLVESIAADQNEINKKLCQIALPDKVRRIKSVWCSITHSEHDINLLKNYMLQRQLSLIGLRKIEPSDNSHISLVYTVLGKLHLFPPQFFPAFLDNDLAIPDFSLHFLKEIWQKNLPNLESQFKIRWLSESVITALLYSVSHWLQAQPVQLSRAIAYAVLWFLKIVMDPIAPGRLLFINEKQLVP